VGGGGGDGVCSQKAPTTTDNGKGPPIKKKPVTPVVGGSVRGQKRTRVSFFFIVFLNSPYRETPKNVIKKIREKVGFGPLVETFVKSFRHDFFAKRFL
jgi:hypothetical protein